MAVQCGAVLEYIATITDITERRRIIYARATSRSPLLEKSRAELSEKVEALAKFRDVWSGAQTDPKIAGCDEALKLNAAPSRVFPIIPTPLPSVQVGTGLRLLGCHRFDARISDFRMPG